MSKAVSADREFNIDRYAELLARAQGGRTQTQFAKDCGLSTAYICKHLNRRVNKAPIPSTLKKIAAAAANGITYEDLLDAAGYNVSKYTSELPIVTTTSGLNIANHMHFKKLGIATITAELSRYNLKWSLNGTSENAYNHYHLDVELSENKLTHWYFKFISFEPTTETIGHDAFFNRVYAYYGHIALMPVDITTKYSFVTNSQSTYDLLMSNMPTALAMHVSIILIDISSLSVIKEEPVRTAFSENAEEILSFR